MAFCDEPGPDASGPVPVNGSAMGTRGVNVRMTESCRRETQLRRVALLLSRPGDTTHESAQSIRAGLGTSLNKRGTRSRAQFSRSANVEAVRNRPVKSPRTASREVMNRGTSTGAVNHKPRNRKNAFTKSSKNNIKR